jgi:DNA repair exonuclease SbcCD ATPase subunit
VTELERHHCGCDCHTTPATQADLRRIHDAITTLGKDLSKDHTKILKEIKTMAEQSQAALAELIKDLRRLADGFVALQAENAALKTALAEADATKAQAVADAIAADDAIDSAAIADADQIVEGLSPEPAPE